MLDLLCPASRCGLHWKLLGVLHSGLWLEGLLVDWAWSGLRQGEAGQVRGEGEGEWRDTCLNSVSLPDAVVYRAHWQKINRKFSSFFLHPSNFTRNSWHPKENSGPKQFLFCRTQMTKYYSIHIHEETFSQRRWKNTVHEIVISLKIKKNESMYKGQNLIINDRKSINNVFLFHF
jgi:uncharacterized protein YchJ